MEFKRPPARTSLGWSRRSKDAADSPAALHVAGRWWVAHSRFAKAIPTWMASHPKSLERRGRGRS